MRVTLADTSLARYAGQFVWLALDFDKPKNRTFLTLHGTTYTPSFYVLDPDDEHATATQLGAMTLPEVTQFLERGERGMTRKANTPAEAALARGDAMLARDQPAAAAAAYGQALRVAEQTWAERDRATGSFTWALSISKQWQRCAETAAAEAPKMPRNEMFGRIVLAGWTCVDQGQAAPWAETARKTLEPLAVEAIALPVTVRDHRFKLYQELMGNAQDRGDSASVVRWGDQWLNELNASKPTNDDERSAFDIARVDAARVMGDSSRVLPALIASEQAMPNNYNASLRLAQMETQAKQFGDAVAACDRGLEHVSGPLGRAWLLQVKADALTQQGKSAEAHRVLAKALRAAQMIGPQQARENNIARISKALKETQKAAK
jgi:predicted negative regulator of RcsB-dependent stress response